MKILITGGAGFIGSHLVNRLISEGHDVVVVDNLSTGTPDHIDTRILQCMDVLNLDMSELKFWPEVIVHMAAELRPSYIERYPSAVAFTNINGTQKVMYEATGSGLCQEVKRVVNISSAAVYGDALLYPTPEDQRCQPKTIYGQSKLAAEWVAAAYAQQGWIELVNLRPFNVYGPGQKTDALIPKLIRAVLRGEQPEIYGDGLNVRDYVYVDDAVDLIVKAATTHADILKPQAVNIARGKGLTVSDIYNLLISIGADRKYIKPKFSIAREGDIRISVGSNAKAKELYGWSPKTDIVDGLTKTVEWWENQ